ncbi:MAG TPA: gamma-glutamyltransferase [Blastocatellia bacterium]|nr:gamma-glutamyltransferase [Blastocatellia bacterium]
MLLLVSLVSVTLYQGPIPTFYGEGATTVTRSLAERSDRPSGPAVGTAGMVSSAHPLATRAGWEILAAGGNAFDAAIAVSATLTVVEPMMSGAGGYGTILLYDAEERDAVFLNCSGRIPAAVNSDVFRPPTPNYLENRRGAKAISTPGVVRCWEALWKEHGELPWPRLFESAIRLADEGFPLTEATARAIAASFAEFPDHARQIYGRNGQPLTAGQKLVQKDLARSLRLIADQGARVFYEGELAQAIAGTVREAGGFLTLDDLRRHEAEWWDPISITYRGYRIVTASPPATSFDALVRLGIMSRFPVKTLGPSSAAFLHRFAEATKIGYRVRLQYAGDPEVAPPPLKLLLSERYWAQEAATIDPQRAKPFAMPGREPAGDRHTTHFVVADRWGNIVSATLTLGNLFGSRIMVKGTGIWLNNSLAYCTFEPKGNPMDAWAGRRKLSGDCPILIFRRGRPWAALGTPGGHAISQIVAQIVMNLVDFGMTIEQAIASPRISFVEPDTIAVERTIPAPVRAQLVERGHKLRVLDALGNAHGLTIEYDRQGRPVRFTGSADPRGEGMALGLSK